MSNNPQHSREAMLKAVAAYRGMVMAVLEGLRQAVYPHCRLEDFYRQSKETTGWAIGLDRVDQDGISYFDSYIHVDLDLDDAGQPWRFVCADREGRQTHTARNALSRRALVRALVRLYRKREHRWWQIWRWLGLDNDLHSLGLEDT